MMNLIIFPEGKIPVAQAGGKAAALSALAKSRISIPPWFVIQPQAFDTFISTEQKQRLVDSDDPVEMQKIVQAVDLPIEFMRVLTQALQQIGIDGGLVAVRSSSVDEDGKQHSFAGQFDSFLYVRMADVPDRIKRVWCSAFSERVIQYRKEVGLKNPYQVPAVLIQRMVSADVSGVAFAADPVSGRTDVCVLSAVYGLGTGLVSGDLDADTWYVDKNNQIIKRELVDKPMAHRLDLASIEGVSSKPVAAELISKPALEHSQVREVTELVRRASANFGAPQDIEWAIERGKLYLLQSRPITTLKAAVEAVGELNIWDNSNIAESYGGVTTPLTFSFARRAYEEVYREFCRILSVSERVIDDNDTTFKRMLGLIRGRVYYNLLSWYRVLAMLPGFRMNRKFMEQMMGVREGLPEQVLTQIQVSAAGSRFKDTLRFIYSMFGLAVNHFRVEKKIRHFYKRLENALALPVENLKTMRAEELADYYRSLERQLLTHWDAPLINDFFAMIFYGTLGKMCLRWCDDKQQTLQNELISGGGGMISAEPALRVSAMARVLMGKPELQQILAQGVLLEIEHAMEQEPKLLKMYQAYIEKFGDRCLDELKLESKTLHDDPLILLRAIANLAQRYQEQQQFAEADNLDSGLRKNAEHRISRHLGNNFIKRRLLNWALKHARARVRDRENLRFERTRLFGRVRRIFLEIGERFKQAGVLAQARDIFYLEVTEVLGFIEGTSTTTNIRELVELRRKEFDAYQIGDAPADRFETHGMVNSGNILRQPPDQSKPESGTVLNGLACCPGVVRGIARVIRDPKSAKLKAGEILVAERTDPGWILLFPIASAILVERGSLLSHAAIVAREMGIPAIVSLRGITRWVTDGELLEIDGSTGEVRKIVDGGEFAEIAKVS